MLANAFKCAKNKQPIFGTSLALWIKITVEYFFVRVAKFSANPSVDRVSFKNNEVKLLKAYKRLMLILHVQKFPEHGLRCSTHDLIVMIERCPFSTF